jgi:hypothetical protein
MPIAGRWRDVQLDKGHGVAPIKPLRERRLLDLVVFEAPADIAHDAAKGRCGFYAGSGWHV